MKNSWNRFVFQLWVPFYDASFALYRKNKEWRLRAFEELGLKENTKLLDVGCGTGLNVPIVPKTVDYTGLDISEAMLNKASQKFPDKKFVIGDACALPFKDGEFDFLINTYSVNVLPDVAQALREMKRVSKKTVLYDHFRSGNPIVAFLQLLSKPFGFLLGIDTFVSIEKELKKAGIEARIEKLDFLGAY